jgi:hypothetical protein
MMHQNGFWLAFLFTIGIIVIWFSASALFQVYQVQMLTKTAPAAMIDWNIVSISSDEYVFETKYSFFVDNSLVKGEMRWKKPIFRNYWSAEEDLKQRVKLDWLVWYSPSNVHHSSLQKNFPIKECLTTGALWVLLFYFLWLGFYVAKFQK